MAVECPYDRVTYLLLSQVYHSSTKDFSLTTSGTAGKNTSHTVSVRIHIYLCYLGLLLLGKVILLFIEKLYTEMSSKISFIVRLLYFSLLLLIFFLGQPYLWARLDRKPNKLAEKRFKNFLHSKQNSKASPHIKLLNYFRIFLEC